MSTPLARATSRTTFLAVRRIPRARSNIVSPLHRKSSSSSTPSKQVSPHIGIYKTFARPVGKVLLMATFTYQVAYWLWVKLENDETKAGKQAEITELENRLRDLTENSKQS